MKYSSEPTAYEKVAMKSYHSLPNSPVNMNMISRPTIKAEAQNPAVISQVALILGSVVGFFGFVPLPSLSFVLSSAAVRDALIEASREAPE